MRCKLTCRSRCCWFWALKWSMDTSVLICMRVKKISPIKYSPPPWARWDQVSPPAPAADAAGTILILIVSSWGASDEDAGNTKLDHWRPAQYHCHFRLPLQYVGKHKTQPPSLGRITCINLKLYIQLKYFNHLVVSTTKPYRQLV